MTIKEFAEQQNLKLELAQIPFRNDTPSDQWDKEARHFAYRIYATQGDNFGKEIKGYYSQGSLVKGKPEIDDILNALIMDTMDIDGSFEDWCSNLGYDTDSRSAYKTFELCQEEDKQLRNLLGSKHQELMECETL